MECRRAYHRDWQSIGRIRQRKRDYADKTRPQRAAQAKRYRKRNPEKVRAAKKRWEAANPDKRAAHIAVNNAVRDGRLTKGPCEVCGATVGVDAHHDDYAKPLKVRWLCHPCHCSKEHRPENITREADIPAAEA
jgi:hypothetical protein